MLHKANYDRQIIIYKIGNKDMNKIMVTIKKYGLWALLIAPIGIFVQKNITPEKEILMWEIIAWVGASVMLMLLITTDNLRRIANGKRISDIGAADFLFKPIDEYVYNSGRERAMYPDVNDPQMIFENPCGFVFGKDKQGKYICMPDLRSILICGGSGSGKSSAGIVNFLMLNKSKINTLYLDPKGELTDITYRNGDNTLIYMPSNKNCCIGYDVFYGINSQSTEQEIFECMQMVAISLIPKKTGDSAIWENAGRELFIGILMYGYMHKDYRTLPEIVRYTLGNSIRDIVTEICEKLDKNSIIYRQVISFKDVSDEVLSSVMFNLTMAIRIFGTDQVLMDSLEKRETWNPSTLLYKSVAVCLDINEITRWGQLIYLIVNQFCSFVFELSEKKDAPERKNICLCLDETVAITQAVGGTLYMLPQALRFARSKGLMCIVAVQSLDGLRCAMDDATVNDMISNFQYKLFYDASTLETQKSISEWCGVFQEKHVSWNGAGAQRTQQITYSESHIVRPQDVMMLAGTGDVILISSRSGYNRLQKVSYYSDPYMKRLMARQGERE